MGPSSIGSEDPVGKEYFQVKRNGNDSTGISNGNPSLVPHLIGVVGPGIPILGSLKPNVGKEAPLTPIGVPEVPTCPLPFA